MSEVEILLILSSMGLGVTLFLGMYVEYRLAKMEKQQNEGRKNMKMIIKVVDTTYPTISKENRCYECNLIPNCYFRKIVREGIIDGHIAFVSFCDWYRPFDD